MKINEIMTKGVEVISSDATIKQAADRMRVLNVGALPVRSNGTLIGILTDRDITVRAIAEGRNPESTPVNEIMSREIQWCYDDQDVQEASRLMKEKQIRRLLIKDRNEQISGIVSLGDISTHAPSELTGETTKEISEPSHPERETGFGETRL
ncbi:MAG: CBS domain-containing protein [Candidatus Omnitrophota bacterium]